MMGTMLVAVVLVLSTGVSSLKAAIPLGELVHDGPVTPEQISVYLPVNGDLARTATARTEIKSAKGTEWVAAHPLHRIRPADTTGRAVADAFAGVITGLKPGTSYTVKVTIRSGDQSETKRLNAITRTLPATTGRPTKTIEAGATMAQVKAVFQAAGPGDVVQFENGTYEVKGLQIERSGTPEKPIVFRGQSRKGVVLKCASGTIIQFLKANDIIVENMTLEGSKTDSGTSSNSKGVSFWNGAPPQERITFRNLIFDGVDMGIVVWGDSKGLLVYDNTLIGNNLWKSSFINSNQTWNDDGIRVPGLGNAVFNNTLKGFGDALAVSAHCSNIGVHFYRNDILMTGDDAFESDYGVRNMTFYDNRTHNAMTLISVDPIHGGPLFAFRNVAINIGRGPYKLNNRNTGFFLYNNTVVRSKGTASGASWGWVQFANGPLVGWGYVNNILIWRGGNRLLAIESSGQTPLDFNHNAWYPDGTVWWTKSGGSFGSLGDALSKLAPVQPVFGKCTKRHEHDVICGANPFTTEVTLAADYLTEIATLYVPALAEGTAPRGAGVAVPGVTDGFEGQAPDMGAIITGRPLPVWGDRTESKSP